MNEKLQNKLQQLGFSEKAALVYLSLLKQGKSTVSEIAKRAGIQRTTVYDVIAELEQEGLVRRSAEPKVKKFLAEPPEKISVILEQKAKELQRKAKEAEALTSELHLLQVKSPAKPKITVVEGREGLRRLYDASLTTKTYIRSFLTPSKLESFDSEFINSYFERRAKKGIKIQGIIDSSDLSKEYLRTAKSMKREVRLVPNEKMNIVPEVYIYDNTISIFSHQEELGVSIESKDIADAFKALYDLAWEHAGEFKQTDESKK